MNNEYKFITNYQNNELLRKSFNDLALTTFGLNFEDWYKNGYWTNAYIPYSIEYKGQIIANISVNLMDFHLHGNLKRYIQLGTVMTNANYRNQGLSRYLMEQILSQYQHYDGIFLYANKKVLDFYPKFGFKAKKEYQFTQEMKLDVQSTLLNTNKKTDIIPVSIKTIDERETFWKCIQNRKSLSTTVMLNKGLYMFYLSKFMKDFVYYHETLDTYIIAEKDMHTITLYDVFAPDDTTMVDITSSFSNIDKIIYGFTPIHTSNLSISELQEDDSTLFIMGNTIDDDLEKIKRFPTLAHA